MVIWGRQRGGNEPDLLEFGLTLNLGSSYQPLGWFSRGIPLIGDTTVPKIGKNVREQALGSMKIGGKKTIFTRGGLKVASRAGDVTKTNKKGEKVIIRKGGNRVVVSASGRITRIKSKAKGGLRVVTMAPEENKYKMVPAGKLKSVKGSKVNPTKK